MPRASIARVSPAVKGAFADQISLSAHQPLEQSLFMSVLDGIWEGMFNNGANARLLGVGVPAGQKIRNLLFTIEFDFDGKIYHMFPETVCFDMN
jgi:hypothetical protein